MLYFKAVLLCILFTLFSTNSLIMDEELPRIAIIGGGVGGTAAAQKLTLLGAQRSVEFVLDLYEPCPIGGRLATILVNNLEFEAGGSIIHNENKYMKDFVKTFNLTKYVAPEGYMKGDRAGFFNGKEFVWLESDWELWTIAMFWWRYGFDYVSLGRKLVNPFIDQFKRIYDLQSEDELSFKNIRELLEALDPNFPPLLNTTIKHLLTQNGFGDLFEKEYVYAATNINYNQDTDIHAFVGAVALAGSQEDLWHVQGGNKKIPEALIQHSDANLIKKKVERIVLTPNRKYALDTDDGTLLYDYVIIAVPLMKNSPRNIKFEGFPKPITSHVNYQRTITTFVHGDLNATYFNYPSGANVPNQIFSVDDSSFFNCVAVNYPVKPDKNYDRKVFKIFSKQPLTNAQLDLLFSTRDEVVVKDWLAYPKYTTEENVLPFVLHENLFYVNAIEWAASAMEMSAISGVNAALLVSQKLSADKEPLD